MNTTTDQTLRNDPSQLVDSLVQDMKRQSEEMISVASKDLVGEAAEQLTAAAEKVSDAADAISAAANGLDTAAMSVRSAAKELADFEPDTLLTMSEKAAAGSTRATVAAAIAAVASIVAIVIQFV